MLFFPLQDSDDNGTLILPQSSDFKVSRSTYYVLHHVFLFISLGKLSIFLYVVFLFFLFIFFYIQFYNFLYAGCRNNKVTVFGFSQKKYFQL